MKMEMKRYKPQYWVFLFGQCALFPEKLEGRLLSKEELAHYIPAYSSTSELIAYLQGYEQENYFKIETTLDSGYLEWERNQAIMDSRTDPLYSDPYSPPDIGAVRRKVEKQAPLTTKDVNRLLEPALRTKTEQYLRFKITDIVKTKFYDELVVYLTKYQQDELTTGHETDPENFEGQQHKLWDAVAKDIQHGNKPTIKQTDVWQTPTGHETFWELILTYQLLTNEIKIANMGYNDRPTQTLATGIFTLARTGTVPFAKIIIMADKFEQATAPPETVTAQPHAPILPDTKPHISQSITIRSYDANTGTLFFGGHAIQIILQKSRRGKAVGETAQGAAMRKLFKDVNTLRTGVPLHTITSVRKDNFDAKKRKLVTNHLDEINRKVKEATGVSGLIVHDLVKYYMDKSYLS